LASESPHLRTLGEVNGPGILHPPIYCDMKGWASDNSLGGLAKRKSYSVKYKSSGLLEALLHEAVPSAEQMKNSSEGFRGHQSLEICYMANVCLKALSIHRSLMQNMAPVKARKSKSTSCFLSAFE
jgi:hypothetical protein